MGDMGDYYRDHKAWQRERRQKLAVECEGCPVIQPKRNPTKLMPGQTCRVCGYRDPRSSEAHSEHGERS